MEEKVDIVALGELLIDFTEAGHSQDGRKERWNPCDPTKEAAFEFMQK